MADLSHRKASERVQFVDAAEKPLAETEIKVEQTNHEFLFGCGGFEFVPYRGTQLFPEYEARKEQLEQRKKLWLDLFNYATLPFYWGQYEPEEGTTREKDTLEGAKYLREKGVTLKGHPLCWHTACAQWLLKYDNDTILEKQLARIEREMTAFKGLINMWDVINEVVIMPIYTRYDNPITRLAKEYGRIGICKKVFNKAYEMNPDGTFLINDFNLSTNYEILIDGLLQSGVPVNCIGLQTHQHQGAFPNEKFEEILSRYEHFGLPIHFTENTIVSAPPADPTKDDLNDIHYEDDASTPEWEQFQADTLEREYRLLFEKHPLVKAISNWDWGDGAWLNAPSGLIRRNSTPKPSYERLHKLIKEEWHTALTVKTDADGYAVIEGFKGEYAAEAKGVSGKFTLAAGDASQKVALA